MDLLWIGDEAINRDHIVRVAFSGAPARPTIELVLTSGSQESQCYWGEQAWAVLLALKWGHKNADNLAHLRAVSCRAGHSFEPVLESTRTERYDADGEPVREWRATDMLWCTVCGQQSLLAEELRFTEPLESLEQARQKAHAALFGAE